MTLSERAVGRHEPALGPGPPDLGIRLSCLAMYALAEREVVRFLRQPHRLLGALGQPVLFWLLFASGLRASFRLAVGTHQVPFGEFFFPGVMVMIVLFTAIFATISIIEDRAEGFLQGVLVSPAPRWAVILGKVMGGTVLALLQVGAFGALAPIAGLTWSIREALGSLVFLGVLGVALTSLGTVFAWRTDSTQGFHAVMSILLFPMWLLSGAFFPAAGAPSWLCWTILLNPLTYGVAGLRHLMYLDDPGCAWPDDPSLFVCLLVTGMFAGLMFALAVQTASRTHGSNS